MDDAPAPLPVLYVALTTTESHAWCMLSIMRSASSMICARREQEGVEEEQTPRIFLFHTHQKPEVVQIQPGRVVDVINQPTRSRHDNIRQAPPHATPRKNNPNVTPSCINTFSNILIFLLSYLLTLALIY